MQAGRSTSCQTGNGKEEQFTHHQGEVDKNQDAENSVGNENPGINLNLFLERSKAELKKMGGEDPQPDDGGKAGYKIVLGNGSNATSITLNIFSGGEGPEHQGVPSGGFSINLYI